MPDGFGDTESLLNLQGKQYDPNLERRWFTRVFEHDQKTYRRKDKLVTRNARGKSHFMIPKQSVAIERETRLRIIEYPEPNQDGGTYWKLARITIMSGNTELEDIVNRIPKPIK